MAYNYEDLTEAEKRHGAAIPGQKLTPVATAALAPASTEPLDAARAIGADRPAYKPQFGPTGAISTAPGYTGKSNVPKEYYGAGQIQDTAADPFAVRRAVQEARVEPGQALNLKYGATDVSATRAPGTGRGRVNVFSGGTGGEDAAFNKAMDERTASPTFFQDQLSRMQAIDPERYGAPAGAAAMPEPPDASKMGFQQYAQQMVKYNAAMRAREAAAGAGAATGLEAQREKGAIGRTQAEIEGRRAAAGEEFTRGLPEREARIKQLGGQTALQETQRQAAQLQMRDQVKVATLERKLEGLKPGSPEAKNVQAEISRLNRREQELKLEQFSAQARARVDAERQGLAQGGEVEGYAEGGAIGRAQAGQLNPLVSQYGQYLQAASQSGVARRAQELKLEQFSAQARARAEAEQAVFGGGQGLAQGGEVEGYADGGAIGRAQAGQLNPLVSQYGQYLQAASQSGVAPVPFAQYINLLSSTRGAMQQTPTQFADGGDVSDLNRPLEGPGTGRSDSIPALIDGIKPAALSRGEFVLDEETTKYYGTKFLMELQRKAKEALAGEGEGVPANG